MSCLTCHSVHRNLPAAEKLSYYRSKCLTCHSTTSCKLEVSQRQPNDDCVSCHMPKRSVPTISHAALTNHRVIRTPDEPYPEAAYIDSANQSPGLIHISWSPESEHNQIAPVALLQAYGALLVKQPSLRSRYLALLNQLKLRQPENPAVLAAAGHEELTEGSAAGAERAAALLSQAIKHGENSAEVALDLADALVRNRRFDEAKGVLINAQAHEPYELTLRKALISLTIKTGNYREATRAMQIYLQIYPNDRVIANLLQQTQLIGAGR